jgi:putative tricarboxylic transport membrane protein
VSNTASRPLLSRKAAEVGFAALLLVFGAVIALGARELETGWGSSGPEAGYFPFRVGLLIMLGAAMVLIRELLSRDAATPFLDQASARNLMLFAVPLVMCVAAIPFLGLYLAATAYLAVAIGLVGRVAVSVTLGVLLLAPLALFILFEFVFRTPLPKGPLGPWLGMI